MFGGDRLLNNFLHGEGSVSGGVKVTGSTVEGSVSGSPLFQFSDNFVPISFSDVDDVPEGGDDVDINATELRLAYPSSETVFWNDINYIFW